MENGMPVTGFERKLQKSNILADRKRAQKAMRYHSFGHTYVARRTGTRRMATPAKQILVLSNDPESARAIAAPLLEAGLDVAPISKTGEAIIHLRKGTVALLVVDACLKETSAKAFLSKAWQFVPQTLRAVFEPQWMDLNLRESRLGPLYYPQGIVKDYTIYW
jgi:hypothetical protein